MREPYTPSTTWVVADTVSNGPVNAISASLSTRGGNVSHDLCCQERAISLVRKNKTHAYKKELAKGPLEKKKNKKKNTLSS